MSAIGGRSTRMSPALVGSITVLILVITTFLAYNANQGLPWVPSKALTVEVENAANIVPGNDVRIGGTRVGIVSKSRAKQYPNGRVTALLDLQLDQNTQELPINTQVLIRARSLLGLKYVQLTPGDRKVYFKWGATVPLRNATPQPVEIDELLNTFDEKTRIGVVQNITAFGNGLAGRGAVIGQLIDAAGPLLTSLTPVAKILANQDAGLVPFLTSVSRFTGELANAGTALPELFRNLDRTSGALARADAALNQTLQVAPQALDTTTKALAATDGLIGPHIEWAKALQPSFENLANGAADLAGATQAGVNGLPGTPATSRALNDVLNELQATGENAIVARGLDGLTQFSSSAAPLVNGLGAAQLKCYYPTLLFRNLASATSNGDTLGNWVSITPYLPPYVNNGEGTSSTTPANGATYPGGAWLTNPASPKTTLDQVSGGNGNGYLWSNPAPVTGQNGKCEPGYQTRDPYTTGSRSHYVKVGSPRIEGPVFKPAPPLGSPFVNGQTSGVSK